MKRRTHNFLSKLLHWPAIFPLAALCCIASLLRAAPLHSFFAGSEQLLLQELPGVAAGEQVWLRIAQGERTLASGPVRAAADGFVSFDLTLPAMQPGVVLPLNISLHLDSAQGPALMDNATAWFFSHYPWPDGYNPVAPRELYLYDPVGTTAEALDSIKLPFKLLDYPRALVEIRDSPIIVAEGIDFIEERGLWDELVEAAANSNCDLLLLAPAAARLSPLPVWSYFAVGSTQRLFLKPVPDGKKRPWPIDLKTIPARAPGGTGFQLVTEEGRVLLATSAYNASEAAVWELPPPGGRIRLCGNAIISRWETTPAARWLLAELINNFITKPKTSSEEKKQ